MTEAKNTPVENTGTKNENFDVDVNVNPPSSSQEDVSRTNVHVEELKISSDALVQTVLNLIHQASIRRILIQTQDGYTLLEIPLSLGVVGGLLGTAFFPILTALGAIAALVTRVRIIVERVTA
ncbi:hypothetical protein NUACC21_69060 [Scytonema sp. NUACC21]